MSFLDVTDAFDKIGHIHVRSLEARSVSPDLCKAIATLLGGNSIVIGSGRSKTNPITLRWGVPQGCPLFLILFNLAIDYVYRLYVYRDIGDPRYASQYGYQLREDLDSVVQSGFADVQAVTSHGVEAAATVVDLIHRMLCEIGLSIIPSKRFESNDVDLADKFCSEKREIYGK